MNDKKSYMEIDELKELTGLSTGSVYKALRDGQIPARRIGKRFIIPRIAVMRWLEQTGSDHQQAA